MAVVGLAKMLSPTIEQAVEAANAPRAVVGILIAMLVLLPETWAAVRAARADRLQSSMNLAVGSALACIGLTVPVVVVASIAFDLPLVLGLDPKDTAMLAVTFLVSAVTLGTGRTHGRGSASRPLVAFCSSAASCPEFGAALEQSGRWDRKQTIGGQCPHDMLFNRSAQRSTGRAKQRRPG
jgi:hypothetical protein